MKAFITSALALSIVTITQGQPAIPSPASTLNTVPDVMVDSGANYNIWQKSTSETGPSGIPQASKHQVIELATGLNHQVDGKWIPSSEQIDVQPDGTAAATNGPIKAYFPSDIFDGVITIVTPAGTVLHSRPVGLSYDTGKNTVMIAELTNSVGYLAGSNQVVYPNAFVGINASLRYTYTKAGFAQDVILGSQPPDPEEFQMDSHHTRLQLLTEFFNQLSPSIYSTTTPNQPGGTLPDECLGFGDLQMIQGRAYSMGNDARATGAWVGKSWENIGGRQILVESVPVIALTAELSQLPQNAALPRGLGLGIVSSKRMLPAQRLAKLPEKHAMLLAQASAPLKGLVLDYDTVVGSLTGYVFQSDTTYYVSGALDLYGTNTFEGGTVIKYATNASITQMATPQTPLIVFKSGPYRPVVFTAIDDNTVGETISGSTGNPSGYYANPALSISSAGTQRFTDFRISFAQAGISLAGTTVTNYDAQFVDCGKAVLLTSSNLFLGNALFMNVNTNFVMGTNATAVVQNGTFNGCSVITANSSSNAVLFLTNCILANVGNDSGSIYAGTNGFYNTTPIGNGVVIWTNYPFISVGEGFNYITNGCIFTNSATSNIDLTLLGYLQQKTVYPPMVYFYTTLSSDLSLYPFVYRDHLGNMSLGYHYDPLDYAFGTVYITNHSITVNPGTAVGICATNSPLFSYGIGLGAAKLICQGYSTNLVHMAGYNTVQEEPGTNWITAATAFCTDEFERTNVVPYISSYFADWSVMAHDALFIFFYSNPTNDFLQNSQFHGGEIQTIFQSVNITNCLFERVYVEYSPFDGYVPCLENNLFWNGTLYMQTAVTNTLVLNNFFDHTAIPVPGKGGHLITQSYNGYVTNCDTLLPTSATDVILNSSPAYQAGPLGNYYLPTISPLINAGSTTANLIGLYYFTTQVNQAIEGNSTVDIGYHYLAL